MGTRVMYGGDLRRVDAIFQIDFLCKCWVCSTGPLMDCLYFECLDGKSFIVRVILYAIIINDRFETTPFAMKRTNRSMAQHCQISRCFLQKPRSQKTSRNLSFHHNELLLSPHHNDLDSRKLFMHLIVDAMDLRIDMRLNLSPNFKRCSWMQNSQNLRNFETTVKISQM